MDIPGSGCSFPALLAETSWARGLAPLLVIVAAVVAVSFLAAMVEAAYLAFPTTKAMAWESSPHAAERMAARLRLDFGKPLATMVIVNNATNIAGSAVVTFYAAGYFKEAGVNVDNAMVAFTFALTLLILIVGEIIPKTIGENHGQAIARAAAFPVRSLQAVLTPVVWLAGHAQKPFQRVGPHPTTEEEIAHLSTIAQAQGAIAQREEDMIHRVLKLNDVTAGEIMTPRAEVVVLPAEQTLGEAQEELWKITRSLVPLYGKNRDDVVAVLDRMDALLALAKDKAKLPLTDPSISMKPYFVPAAMSADKLLVRLQRRTEHMAIVVGDYGETLGVVTLEDVLEELVGEIYDEEDLGTGNGLTRVGPEELLARGAAEIKDVNVELGTEIPNHRSVAGFLLDALERIPKKGESLEAHGVRFAVEDANDRAILAVRIRKLPPPEPAAPE